MTIYRGKLLQEEINPHNIRMAKLIGYKVGRLGGWVFGDSGECAYKKVDDEIVEAIPINKLNFHLSIEALWPVLQKIRDDIGDPTVWKEQHIAYTLRTLDVDKIWRAVAEYVEHTDKPPTL